MPPSEEASGWRSRRGQVLVIFSGTFVVLLLMSALVIDLAWLWNNSLRIQRTADAAALAGVVHLPNDVPSARTAAWKEATRNGYANLSGGVRITPTQDATNGRRLNVKVTAPVKTFFLGLIGMSTIPITRLAHAEYVLPVPMGSPENYYGNFGTVRNSTYTIPASSTGPTTSGVQNTGTGASSHVDSTVPGTATWTVSGTGTLVNSLRVDDNNYGGTNTNNRAQQWSGFGLSGALPVPGATVSGNTTTTRTVTITGLQLQLLDAFVSAACANSNIKLALSWNAGANWTPITAASGSPNQGTTTPSLTTGTATDYTIGNTNNTTPWGPRVWVLNTTTNNFSDANFRVRTTSTKGCATAGTRINLDRLEVTVYYTVTTSTSTPAVTTTTTYALRGPGAACLNGRPNCFQPTGQVLNPRGFWATMNTQGSENINGDAFQPYYDTRTAGVALACPTSTPKACNDPDTYYNYAIEMQPNTGGGYVYVFDPVFCQTDTARGTGDRWFSGNASVSSWYTLYEDPNNTPYNFLDDVLWQPIDNTFRQVAASDFNMVAGNGEGSANHCEQTSAPYGDARDYHNSWYLVNPGKPLFGGPNGTTFRLHTTGTDPASPTQQRGTNAEQSFAIYATDLQAPAIYPKVYGLGAMQAFTPLSASGSPQQSEFYLAQVDPVHRGKTLEIRLWDPGDTAPLTAALEILIPDSSATGGYRGAAVTYSGSKGTTNSSANSACNNNSRSSASATPIQTSTGAALGLFNGCWLTVQAVIPSWYDGDSGGWWKIRYTMNGSGTSNDVTTWTADLRGNPVHLVQP